MSRSLKAHVLLVIVSAIWGVTFVVIKEALSEISPLIFNAIRMTLAAATLAIFYRRELQATRPATLASGSVVGIFLWLGYEFQTSGLQFTTPSKSAFLTGISVVLVPIFMALFFKRAVNRWTSLGVVAAFVGLFLMTVPGGPSPLGDWSSVNIGDLLTIGCALAFAFHIIFLGRAIQSHRFERIAVIQTAVAAALMVPTTLLLEQPVVRWSGSLVLAILATGLLATAAAFTIQAWAQQFTPPTHTALIFALEPVFAGLASFLLLGERLGSRAALGAVLILGGVLLSELKGLQEEAGPEV